MAGNHQVLVGLDNISGDAAPGCADAWPVLAVGCFVEFQAQPAASTADGAADWDSVFADTRGEYDAIEAAERCGERADLTRSAIVEHFEGKPRAGLLARQQFAEIR